MGKVSKLVSEGTGMSSSPFAQRVMVELLIGLVAGGEWW